MNSRLALGTVQFGMNYGVANACGKVNSSEAGLVLDFAKSQGVDTLDTAIAYGDSENVLGEIGVNEWKVISKFPAANLDGTNIRMWVANAITESLGRLGIPMLNGILLHDSSQLSGEHGEVLYDSLQNLKTQGLVEKIGVSIYNPNELEQIIDRYNIDIVQAPFNVFDQRLEETGWLTRLNDLNIEVHTRSVFLQGLLLMDKASRPPKFQRWQEQWRTWHQWLNDNNTSALHACLSFVLSYSGIKRVVVGVDGLKQLEEIIASALKPCHELPKNFSCNDIDLINPSHWHHL